MSGSHGLQLEGTRFWVKHRRRVYGPFDYEWCWQFGSVERVLIYGEPAIIRAGVRSTRVEVDAATSAPTMLEFTAETDSNPTVLPDVTVVSRMLIPFGIETSGFFNPHTRQFPWEDYVG